MHDVYLTRRTQKEIDKLGHEAQDRDRIRVGDYRIIYTLEDEEVDVLVVRVRHRRDAYR